MGQQVSGIVKTLGSLTQTVAFSAKSNNEIYAIDPKAGAVYENASQSFFPA